MGQNEKELDDKVQNDKAQNDKVQNDIVRNEKELDDIINMLDGLAANDYSRIKINASEDIPEGSFTKEYHHGRCDVGSPWARGCAFDVLE